MKKEEKQMEIQKVQLYSEKKNPHIRNTKWKLHVVLDGVSVKAFPGCGWGFFVFLKSTHISTNTLMGGKSYKIPGRCQA